MRFSDKAVLITGGAKGIGKAIALGFAESGALVVLMDIDELAGNDTAQTIKGLGGQHFSFKEMSLREEMLGELLIMPQRQQDRSIR